jgi:tetratricopeptide (TPR) repeat protein
VVVWTSTESQTDSTSKWAAQVNTALTPFYAAEMTQASMGVFCVRPMETDLLQVAKAAAVNHPVPDIQTLQTFIPLNKARLAYQSGNYQESITQAQLAISLKADPATANWGIGISYGRLGQWDQAITNLQSALVIDKDFAAAETALKWAKAGQKAAKKGKLPKEPTPKWN